MVEASGRAAYSGRMSRQSEADNGTAATEAIPDCPRCHKPLALCVCDSITPIENRVSLLILQHPQEQDSALGTARLTAMHFANAVLKIGLSWPSLSKALGRPVADPHGDPIPTAGGKVHPQRFASLATCPLDRPVRIVRILDQEPNFLRFVDQCGLTPTAIVRVQQRDPLADAVRLRIAKDKSSRHRVLSGGVAARFLVRDP